MNGSNRSIVAAALDAKTAEEAADLQSMITMQFGEEYFRPLGDRWGNFGILASAADYDLKLVELITNMQDAVIERAALRKYGTRAIAASALRTPREAVANLRDELEQAASPEVTFWESDPPATRSHKLSVWFDDRGTGMTTTSIPDTIFALGGSNKEDAPYLQGAFGLGGELMYRNSEYVVLVTRRAPELLTGDEEDRISVAVVQWNDQTKTQTAAYLVDRAWSRAGDIALPWSCPAADFPEFEAGTHVGLISYGTAGLYRKREADERSFDTIVNTRLYNPMLSTRWRNHLARGDSRATNLPGLRKRLDRVTTHNFPHEEDQVPFVYAGKQYFLRASYVLFSERGQAGGRRKFVAHGHAVLFTSNGQVQTHWTPGELKQKTKLKKLDGRLLVEIDLDALPVDARTALVTPDRAETVKSDVARKLDEAVASFLDDWDSLLHLNEEIRQEQLRSTTDVSTRGVSDQIRRALSARGFGGSGRGAGSGGPGGTSSSGGRSRPKQPKRPPALFADPTAISGPKTLTLETGRTRSQRFTIDAVDAFFEHARGELEVEAGANFVFESVSDIVAIGRPRNGTVRLSFAIPDGYEDVQFDLRLVLKNWARAAGGLGPDLVHNFKVTLVAQIPGRGTGEGRKPTGSKDASGHGQGENAVLLWVRGVDRDWQPTVVGELEKIPALEIAQNRPEFADLAELGDAEIDCITLNSDYQPLVRYVEARSETVVSTNPQRNRYAVGVGVHMLALAEEEHRLAKAGHPLDEESKAASSRAAARGVLAMLPEFDRILQVSDIDE
jgi:hypothetical protein